MKPYASALAATIVMIAASTTSATNVRFSFIDERGSNATRAVTITPDPNANPVVLGTNLLFIKALTTNITGSAVIPLLPITYTLTFQGSLTRATLYVFDTNAVMDMVTLTTNLYQITNIQPQYVTVVDGRQLTLTNDANLFKGRITFATNSTTATNLAVGGVIGTILTVAVGSGSTLLQANGVESVKWDDNAGVGNLGGLAFRGDTFFDNGTNHFNGDVRTDGAYFGEGSNLLHVTSGFTGNKVVYTNTFHITNGLVKAID